MNSPRDQFSFSNPKVILPDFLLVSKNAVVNGKSPPQKGLCGSLLCVLSQEMRHINSFAGLKMGVLCGGQKVSVETNCALVVSLLTVTARHDVLL